MTPTISPRALNRALLARQMLLERATCPAVDAVARLVAIQAQVARPPFLGLWTRLQSFVARELTEALHARTVVRVTSLRGTLHLMTAQDYLAMRGALQPMLTRGSMSTLRARGAGLDVAALDRVARRFFSRGPATFDALRHHLQARFPGADERAMAYAIRMHVPLVQVPTDSVWAFPAAADFALADRWLAREVSTEPAPLDAIVLRYLAAFGPATPADAQAWSGASGLREVFERLRPSLVSFRDARRRELFDLPDAPRPDPEVPAPVRFLPEFDNLVLSHEDRTRVIADEHRPRVTLKNLQVRATFLVDGMVAGAWRSERKRHAAVLVLEPFGAVAKRVRSSLEREAEAVLGFVEPDATSCEVRWAP